MLRGSVVVQSMRKVKGGGDTLLIRVRNPQELKLETDGVEFLLIGGGVFVQSDVDQIINVFCMANFEWVGQCGR